jgi:hypothetical protein
MFGWFGLIQTWKNIKTQPILLGWIIEFIGSLVWVLHPYKF